MRSRRSASRCCRAANAAHRCSSRCSRCSRSVNRAARARDRSASRRRRTCSAASRPAASACKRLTRREDEITDRDGAGSSKPVPEVVRPNLGHHRVDVPIGVGFLPQFGDRLGAGVGVPGEELAGVTVGCLVHLLLPCSSAFRHEQTEATSGTQARGARRVLPQGRRQAPLPERARRAQSPAGTATPWPTNTAPQSGDHSGVRHRRSAAVSRSGAREVGDARQPFTATGKRIAKGRWQQHSTVRGPALFQFRESSLAPRPASYGCSVAALIASMSAICVAVRSQVPRGGRPLPGWARGPDPFFVNIERSTFRARTGTTAETANHPRTQLEWAL